MQEQQLRISISSIVFYIGRRIFIRNNEKYIDRQSNFVTSGKKMMNEF